MTRVYQRNTSPSRVTELLATRPAGEVAAILRISTDEVLDIAEAATRPRVNVVIRNNRTGQTARARSWRAAYRRAQELGFADWEWWEDPTIGETD